MTDHLEDCGGNGFGFCPECDGDGIMIVGWSYDAHENIEGPCTTCNQTWHVYCPACEEETL